MDPRFAEAQAAVRKALLGKGKVEPAPSTEFYNYVTKAALTPYLPTIEQMVDTTPGSRTIAATATYYEDDEPVEKVKAAFEAGEKHVTKRPDSCPGRELEPNPCRCPCYGCRHHCSAHDPADVEVSPVSGAPAAPEEFEWATVAGVLIFPHADERRAREASTWNGRLIRRRKPGKWQEVADDD